MTTPAERIVEVNRLLTIFNMGCNISQEQKGPATMCEECTADVLRRVTNVIQGRRQDKPRSHPHGGVINRLLPFVRKLSPFGRSEHSVQQTQWFMECPKCRSQKIFTVLPGEKIVCRCGSQMFHVGGVISGKPPANLIGETVIPSPPFNPSGLS